MLVQHETGEKKGRFFIEQEGQRLAEMVYNKLGTRQVIIEHTEVHDTLKGQGAGRAMVQAGVQWAREQQKRIIPLCPFAKLIFKKYPELRDVL